MKRRHRTCRQHHSF